MHILFGICGGMVGRAGAPLSRGDGRTASGGSHIKLRRKEVSQVTIGSISFAHTQSPNIRNQRNRYKNVKILYIRRKEVSKATIGPIPFAESKYEKSKDQIKKCQNIEYHAVFGA